MFIKTLGLAFKVMRCEPSQVSERHYPWGHMAARQRRSPCISSLPSWSRMETAGFPSVCPKAHGPPCGEARLSQAVSWGVGQREPTSLSLLVVSLGADQNEKLSENSGIRHTFVGKKVRRKRWIIFVETWRMYFAAGWVWWPWLP